MREWVVYDALGRARPALGAEGAKRAMRCGESADVSVRWEDQDTSASCHGSLIVSHCHVFGLLVPLANSPNRMKYTACCIEAGGHARNHAGFWHHPADVVILNSENVGRATHEIKTLSIQLTWSNRLLPFANAHCSQFMMRMNLDPELLSPHSVGRFLNTNFYTRPRTNRVSDMPLSH